MCLGEAIEFQKKNCQMGSKMLFMVRILIKQGPFHSNKYFVTTAEIIAASAGARFQGNFLIGMLYLF